MDGANTPPGTDDRDKLRLVLDYLPCDVCLSVPSEEDQDTLCSICSRLNRTIVERVVVHGEPTPAEEREAVVAALPEDEAAMADDVLDDALDSDLDSSSSSSETSESEDTEDEDELATVEVVLAEERDEPDVGHTDVVVAGPIDADDDTEDEPAPSLGTTPWPEPATAAVHGSEDEGDVLVGLSPFTVVAPVRGTMEGAWMVPGDSELGPGELASLSDELSGELDAPLTDAPGWPDEGGDALDLDLDIDLEPDVEAEPEQADPDEDLTNDEPDDSFWEDLLEGNEGAAEADDDIPAFESAEEDWPPADEPAEAEPATAASAVSDQDVIDDLWDDDLLETDAADEDTAVLDDEEASADDDLLAFEVDAPTGDDTAIEDDEDELDFEEVDFALADDEEEDEAPERSTGEPPALDAWAADAAEPADVANVEPEEITASVDEDEEPEVIADVEGETMGEADWPAEELDATDLAEGSAAAGAAYEHGPYTLYHKVVETGDGETRDLYFFARQAPDDASPSELPDGYEVGVNERTGVPFVRRER